MISISCDIDFVAENDTCFEVKRGKANPVEFGWFVKSFPGSALNVINEREFSTDRIKGMTLENFLLSS